MVCRFLVLKKQQKTYLNLIDKLYVPRKNKPLYNNIDGEEKKNYSSLNVRMKR